MHLGNRPVVGEHKRARSDARRRGVQVGFGVVCCPLYNNSPVNVARRTLRFLRAWRVVWEGEGGRVEALKYGGGAAAPL